MMLLMDPHGWFPSAVDFGLEVLLSVQPHEIQSLCHPRCSFFQVSVNGFIQICWLSSIFDTSNHRWPFTHCLWIIVEQSPTAALCQSRVCATVYTRLDIGISDYYSNGSLRQVAGRLDRLREQHLPQSLSKRRNEGERAHTFEKDWSMEYLAVLPPDSSNTI